MWCYQKPGFESLLLNELWRQQQCSQFCDTVLQTDGISLPAHSCVLSAISPCFSSSLSSMLPPPAGHHRLLDFQSLGAYTLLNLVRLLYSGEMVGEGEEERIKAISAAAKLGIFGLVEVRKDAEEEEEEEEEDEGWRGVDAGVQTEANNSWRQDGCEESASKSGKDVWTQTEDHHTASPPPQPVYETIDMDVFQNLGDTDPQYVTPEMPCIPLSYIYPLDEAPQPLSDPVYSQPEPTASGHTAEPLPPPPFQSDPQGSVVADDEWQKMPRYINHYLSSDGAPHPALTWRDKTSRGGGARRAGRPRGRARGRGRAAGGNRQLGRLLPEVKVSRLQAKFLHRLRTWTSRTGQGGGAVGHVLAIKSRKQLSADGASRRRAAINKVWALSPSGELLLRRRRGWTGATLELNQVSFSAQSVMVQSGEPGLLESSLLLSTPLLMEEGMADDGPSCAPAPHSNLPPPAPAKTDWASLLLETDSDYVMEAGEGEEEMDLLESLLSSLEKRLEGSVVQQQAAAPLGGGGEAVTDRQSEARQDPSGDGAADPKDASLPGSTGLKESGSGSGPVLLDGNNNKLVSLHAVMDRQLLQRPVVRLIRSTLLTDTYTCLDLRPPDKTNTDSSAPKQPYSKDDPRPHNRKWYPIRSQYKCTDPVTVLNEPLEYRRRKSSLSPGTRPAAGQSQARRVRRDECVRQQSRWAGRRARRRRRRANSPEEANDGEPLDKRVPGPSWESEERGGEHLLTCAIQLREPTPEPETGPPSTGAQAQQSSNEDTDEEVDVVGGGGPIPSPVAICWDEVSQDEEEEEVDEDEEVDVVG